MHAILCNLDSHWEFPAWIQRHGLDLVAEGRVTLWDVAGEPGGQYVGVPPWPQRLQTHEVLSELEEMRTCAHDKPQVLFLWVASSDAELNPDWLAEAAGQLPEETLKLLFYSYPQGTAPPVLTACHDSGAVDYVVISRAQGRERFYALRLVLEAALDQRARPEIFPTARNGNQHPWLWALTLEPASAAEEPIDAVLRIWPPYVGALLAHAEMALHGDKAAHVEWRDEAREYRQGITGLLERQVSPDYPNWGAVLATLVQTAPFFHQPALGGVIEASGQAFYQALENHLAEWYAHLNREHDALRDGLVRDGEQALESLHDSASRARLGYQREVVRELNAQLSELEALGSRASAHEQAQLQRMRGDFLPSTRAGADWTAGVNRGFIRPPFVEDEWFEHCIRDARLAAERLAGRPWFLGGLGVVTLLAALPVLAFHTHNGFSTLVGRVAPAQAMLYGFGWILLWMVIAAIAMGLVGWRRRRALHQALSAVRTAAEALIKRHKQAFDASYRYLYGMEALRRINRLSTLCRRRREAVTEGIEAIHRLQQFLQNQHNYYRNLGYLAADAPPALGRLVDLPPPAWLAATLNEAQAGLRNLEPTRLEIAPSEYTPGLTLRCRYLAGLTRISLLPKAPDRA